MATKKRLADLVREEVNKKSDETDASEKTQGTKRSNTSSKSSKPSAQLSKASTKSTTALKSKITTLEKENQTLKSDNQKLLDKISALESDLEASSKLEASLKASQTKQKSTQVALDEAKHDALKLAQENQKLLDKIKALESQKQPAAIAKTAPSRPAAKVRQSSAIQRTSRPQPIYKAPAKKPFSRPISPSRMPGPRVVQNSDEFETWCYD